MTTAVIGVVFAMYMAQESLTYNTLFQCLLIALQCTKLHKVFPVKRVVQGGSLARFTNGKIRGSQNHRITDIKISFSRIMEISK